MRKGFLQKAYVIKDHTILRDLITNTDQMQMTLAQGCHMTYDKIESNQVATVGAEEKCAIMVLITLTGDGLLLPFQSIHKGMTKGLLPKSNSPCMAESLEAGFLFKSQ